MNEKQKIIFNDVVCSAEQNANFGRQLDAKNKARLYRIKYICWIICFILLSPYRKGQYKKIIWALSKNAEQKLVKYSNDAVIIRLGLHNSSVHDIRNNTSVLSSCSCIKRLRLAFAGFKLFLNSDFNCCLGEFLEYYFISQFFFYHQIEQVFVSHAYERYNTLITHLAHELNIKIILVQDGIAIDLIPPQKIFANLAYVFDSFEEKIIKKNIENDGCVFCYVGFQTTIEWDIFPNSNKRFLVAIASQDWLTEQTKELIEGILNKMGTSDSYSLIVYPHYRESAEAFSAFRRFSNVVISPKGRFRNIDLLITFYSTMAYDYWSLNPNIPVFCLKMEGYEPAYYQKSNVLAFSDIDSLVHQLKFWLDNNEK